LGLPKSKWNSTLAVMVFLSVHVSQR